MVIHQVFARFRASARDARAKVQVQSFASMTTALDVLASGLRSHHASATTTTHKPSLSSHWITLTIVRQHVGILLHPSLDITVITGKHPRRAAAGCSLHECVQDIRSKKEEKEVSDGEAASTKSCTTQHKSYAGRCSTVPTAAEFGCDGSTRGVG